MLGDCPFEPGEKRTAKQAPSFELFRFLSRLVTLRLTAGRTERPLSAEEIARASRDFGQATKGVTFTALRRKLDLDRTPASPACRPIAKRTTWRRARAKRRREPMRCAKRSARRRGRRSCARPRSSIESPKCCRSARTSRASPRDCARSASTRSFASDCSTRHGAAPFRISAARRISRRKRRARSFPACARASTIPRLARASATITPRGRPSR